MRSPALAPIFAVGGIGPKNQGSISKWRSSFEGSIGRDHDGNPAVRAHYVVVLLRNGAVYAGPLLQSRVSLTMEFYLTDSEPLSTASAQAT